ncbi:MULTISPECIES: alpha/beta hydrolase [Flammeovirga]|uniref:Alpha/beta hydrolase n=1 Tax=Flammeovirga agarivorans TaxID=2726742 RepID=A0A7X8SKB9_9BACT|nr:MULTISPECIES: alpha/beta hydrolase-fold protein [Flammeovirga]NLR91722.1 alpha/beta hydrolase [Flammeovirga agarivorans]
MNKLLFIFAIFIAHLSIAQEEICSDQATGHTIQSKYLNEERDYWVSLPLYYNDSLSYPVIYVFDAEWRFNLIKNMVFDLGANEKIQKSIVVGIPHIDWEFKRGQDLTFSQSRIEYDGEAVDSTWYNNKNSGHGMKFYHYLTKELMVDVDKHYATNGFETLIGHSYGGYFGGYILSMDQPFEVIHIYDPSIWFSNGEVIQEFKNNPTKKKVSIHLTYQPEPKFHKEKIEAFIKELKGNKNIKLTTKFYPDDTHNSLFIDSFYQGILETNR